MNLCTGKSWKVTPVRGGPSFYLAEAPNFFHRWMSRIFLGVMWSRD